MEKRIIALFSAVCILLGALLWRTMDVGQKQETQVLQRTNTRVLTVGTSRGVIYDRNLQPLAPSDERLIAAAAPCEAAMQTMTALFGKDAAKQMLLRGAPCLAKAAQQVETPFVRTFSVPVRRGDSALAAHLIGTLDGENHGSGGIEKAFDALLRRYSGSLSVRFSVDAAGRVLPGEAKEILDANFNSKGGVALTIDSEMQRVTEAALQNSRIQSGCAVIMDVQTGEIRAMASVPSFDTEAANPSLSPFTNKALGAYSVGSVFKPLLAAFALEHGVKRSFSYTCTGTCQIGETQFQCFGKKAHGKQTMKEALENSCNTYFIRLMQKIDETAFLSFCETLGFSRPLPLCDGLFCSKGSLPAARDLLLPGERANFAFGQGRLLASPVQLLSVYQLLATGLQTPPTVLCGTVDEHGALQRETPFAPVRRLKETTVRQMQALLAASAKAAGTVGAGKTGTAQSGIFADEKEVCRTWFAGFFPAKMPRYAVVILNENGVSGAADCAPVFGEICRALP
ncbi:MAG: penicillin-binding protein 2 [Clostridia bacterium]|nr:penicillin-binding protein 2 [Clostridia bacterium]